jgi:hypothetical protein
MQEGMPVAYYSKMCNSAQMNYATIDEKLLCVVVHTDHKNILSIGDSSQQGLCWISHVDEYGLELHYLEGPRNAM